MSLLRHVLLLNRYDICYNTKQKQGHLDLKTEWTVMAFMKADSKAFLLTNFVTSVITQNIFKYASHRCDSISNHFQARTRPNCQKM